MNSTPSRGRVAVIGAGPAGMATALSAHQAGHDVMLFERYAQARPAGNILNLWPPPIKALGLMGVDLEDFGAPCRSEFQNVHGHRRVHVNLPQDVVDQYGGGFIGLLRPELYERLLGALPEGMLQTNRGVERIEQDRNGARLFMADGEVVEADVVVGADGIHSMVRKTLWGDQPIREHNLHIFGGFIYDPPVEAEAGLCLLTHDRTTQGAWTSIRRKGRDGFQWWVLTAHDATEEFTADLHDAAADLASGFPAPLPQLIAATPPENVQRWVLRDRKPLKQWSQGRVTIVGDAAHPTSPYAAYGAGMSIEDGYFLGRALAGVDLKNHDQVSAALVAFEAPRRPHTARHTQVAWALGKVFHHAPRPLQPVRDAILDHTPLLQKLAGDSNPQEILGQLDEIDEAEQRFRATTGQSAT
ncbi:FAD-dependent oxidoreductase [Kocuria sp. CH-021]|uniref:FAD-dependent oxidoreductase n=1 Tax=Kocuria sp. CH-021 TaxID=3406735 RepID=UPI003C71F056